MKKQLFHITGRLRLDDLVNNLPREQQALWEHIEYYHALLVESLFGNPDAQKYFVAEINWFKAEEPVNAPMLVKLLFSSVERLLTRMHKERLPLLRLLRQCVQDVD